LTSLESYLTGDILRDRADIDAIEITVRETATTITATFMETHWPYEVKRGSQLSKPKVLSESTTAMMIRAIDLILNIAGEKSKNPSYAFDLDDKIVDGLQTNRKAAFGALLGSLTKGSNIDAQSKTYGRNDPLTLSFLAEIRADDEPLSAFLKKVLQHPAADSKPNGQFFDYKAKRGDRVKFERSVPLSNAFIPLRFLRTCRLMGVVPPDGDGGYLRYFESTLHDQLSFISIPDSRFDPAELAFCLEGMLLCAKSSVDPALFSRVLDVLKAAQESSAHWRPTKPFLKNERGLVLFPLSVEAANAILRSCLILEEDSRFERSAGEVVRLLRRFWEWLSARRVSFRIGDGPELAGWHSEHVADADTIQLWDTAQVVDFLLQYRRRLRRYVAHTTLRLARFSHRSPIKPKQPWKQETREVQKLETPKEPSTVVKEFEPVTSLGASFETYRRIGEDFVERWLKEDRENCSMLLYGPPGTGKTSVAENIADALRFPLITITVSDFLAEGGGAVEARAKMIFEVLDAQADCVVLFDEIDELILDRSSARHSAQETVFKFMTPGMLTKLNNLRQKKRIIFILATNYAYRIDPAIRRTGRIDQNYLLLPLDAGARKQKLCGFLKKRIAPEELPAFEEKLEDLSRAALFLGYKDIEAAVAKVSRQAAFDPNLLEVTLRNFARTTSLEFYRGGFSEVDDPEWLKMEFLPLVQMAVNEGSGSEQLPAELQNKKKKPVFESVDEMRNEARKLTERGLS